MMDDSEKKVCSNGKCSFRVTTLQGIVDKVRTIEVLSKTSNTVIKFKLVNLISV